MGESAATIPIWAARLFSSRILSRNSCVMVSPIDAALLAGALARQAVVEQELLDPKTLRDAKLLASLGRESQRLTQVAELAVKFADATLAELDKP